MICDYINVLSVFLTIRMTIWKSWSLSSMNNNWLWNKIILRFFFLQYFLILKLFLFNNSSSVWYSKVNIGNVLKGLFCRWIQEQKGKLSESKIPNNSKLTLSFFHLLWSFLFPSGVSLSPLEVNNRLHAVHNCSQTLCLPPLSYSDSAKNSEKDKRPRGLCTPFTCRGFVSLFVCFCRRPLSLFFYYSSIFKVHLVCDSVLSYLHGWV